MFPQVLVFLSFLLARVGYDGYTPAFGSTLDHTWLGYLTVGGWLIIIPAIIIGIVAGDPMSWRMVTGYVIILDFNIAIGLLSEPSWCLSILGIWILYY